MNATGVVYTTRSVQRRLTMPSRTLFGVHYILTSVGIQILFVLLGRLPRAETGDGQMRIPRFLYAVHKMLDS